MENEKKSKASSEHKYLKKNYHKMVKLEENEIDFIVNDVYHTTLPDGQAEVFDSVSVDFMIEDMAAAIKSNSTKFNPTPKTVFISQKKLEENELQSLLSQATQDVSVPLVQAQTISNLPLENTSQQSTTKEVQTEGNPTNIVKDETSTTLEQAKAVSDEIVKKISPRYTIDDVYVEPHAKRQIMSALIMAKQRHKLFFEWGLNKVLKGGRALCLNFYGPPGTGKSMMAEAIAKYLDKDVYNVNYSELESSTPGESAKNIVKIFQLANASNAVLIFDEADSMLGKRLTNVTGAADYGINVTRSVMLIEIERFHGVIIFTTNFISNYDIAFKRRILASIEFKMPDEKGRAQIWNTHIPKELPLSKGITPTALALKFGGTTGADIKDIVLFASVNCLDRGRDILTWEDFDNAYSTVRNRYAVI